MNFRDSNKKVYRTRLDFVLRDHLGSIGELWMLDGPITRGLIGTVLTLEKGLAAVGIVLTPVLLPYDYYLTFRSKSEWYLERIQDRTSPDIRVT